MNDGDQKCSMISSSPQEMLTRLFVSYYSLFFFSDMEEEWEPESY